MLGGQWAGGQGLGKCGRQEGGPSGSVPSVLLAKLSSFPVIPAPSPNSSELIHCLLRLTYAAKTEGWGSLAPGGATRQDLAQPTTTDCFRWVKREAKERKERAEKGRGLTEFFLSSGLYLGDCLSFLRWGPHVLDYSRTSLTLTSQAYSLGKYNPTGSDFWLRKYGPCMA